MTKGFLCFFAVARRFIPPREAVPACRPYLGIRPCPRAGCRVAGRGMAPLRSSASFAQAGPVSSYSTAEERMMVASIVPSAAGSMRWPSTARPMETPA